MANLWAKTSKVGTGQARGYPSAVGASTVRLKHKPGQGDLPLASGLLPGCRTCQYALTFILAERLSHNELIPLCVHGRTEVTRLSSPDLSRLAARAGCGRQQPDAGPGRGDGPADIWHADPLVTA